MLEALRHEATTGWRHLVGAHLTGTVPVSQDLLNEALTHLPGAPAGLTLDVQPANHVIVRYGPVRATIVLDETVAVNDGPPQLTGELRSSVVAFTLRQTLRLPAVRIDGRRITIDVAAIEGADAYRPYWSRLQSTRLRTTPGQLHVEFEWAVT